MPTRSLKKSLYILIAAILVQTGMMALDYHFHHRAKASGQSLHAIFDVERAFLAMLIEENRALRGSADDMPLTGRYREFQEMARHGQLNRIRAGIDRRRDIYTQLFALTREGRRLHRRLNQIILSLVPSVRYIHEHHIVNLKNLLSRGRSDQDYDTGENFQRSPVRSAPELDLIQAAVAIQTGMLDVFETFSKLERGFSPAAVSIEFQERILSFYSAVNTLEDFSLDAQDGLLVEELLVNGRTFENSFKRFLEIEKQIRDLSAEMGKSRHFLADRMETVITRIETTNGRLDRQIEILKHASLLVNAIMLGLLFFFGRQTITAIRNTIQDTGRIQDDVSYQIPMRQSDFIEFQTIYSALNAMAGTINNQVVKLEESRNLLEKRVAERTRSLSRVNEKLTAEIRERIENEKKRLQLEAQLSRSEKIEAIGTLAGGVAHDLNNILSGIISYPELILLDLPADHPLRDTVMTIKSSGEKAATIVEDLLTLARRGIAIHDPVELNALVEQFIDSPECKNILSHHPNVHIDCRLTPDIGYTTGSPVHLSKTIMNLVSNAAEAMPDGGMIAIATAREYVDFTIRGYDEVKEGEYLKMSVQDTGIGIDPEDMKRIFEPFFTKKQMGRSGTGLGMAVVWGTVRDHDGYIDVISRCDAGTTFTLYLPLVRPPLTVPDDEARVPLEQYKGRGETVLVVDDVPEQREIATRILEKLAYRVTSVPNGLAAVDYLEKQSADILLLDMIMAPGIDGLETYRRVTAVAPGQKAVIASGFSETALVLEAQRLGAGPYIKKPYGLEQIGQAIRKELDRPETSVAPVPP